jgi:hypothetical protein
MQIGPYINIREDPGLVTKLLSLLAHSISRADVLSEYYIIPPKWIHPVAQDGRRRRMSLRRKSVRHPPAASKVTGSLPLQFLSSGKWKKLKIPIGLIVASSPVMFYQ